MLTSSDVELAFAPVASAAVGSHFSIVDEEVTEVVVLLGADLAEEAHLTVARDVDRHLHDRSVEVGHASAAALHAVLAFIRILGSEGPRIGTIQLPLEVAVLEVFEVFDDVARGQAAAPVHLHVR